MRVDVSAFLGRYPWRKVSGGSPHGLLEAMDRCAIDQAWISNSSAVFWKDPSDGNAVLYLAAAQNDRFRPVPAIHPGIPDWERTLDEAKQRGAPAVRADAVFYGLDPVGSSMRALAEACADRSMPIMMAVKLEDIRQRHSLDRAPELTSASVRTLIRSHPRLRLITTHADREFVEQVHFGSTPEEAVRMLWDICWIWGPPEDHLELLLRTVGLDRFAFGTGMPLRIPETSVAKLDLLNLSDADRARIESGNLAGFAAR